MGGSPWLYSTLPYPRYDYLQLNLFFFVFPTLKKCLLVELSRRIPLNALPDEVGDEPAARQMLKALGTSGADCNSTLHRLEERLGGRGPSTVYRRHPDKQSQGKCVSQHRGSLANMLHGVWALKNSSWKEKETVSSGKTERFLPPDFMTGSLSKLYRLWFQL